MFAQYIPLSSSGMFEITSAIVSDNPS